MIRKRISPKPDDYYSNEYKSGRWDGRMFILSNLEEELEKVVIAEKAPKENKE
jgi:hypothetical protein